MTMEEGEFKMPSAPVDVERTEEDKLRAKYKLTSGAIPSGHSVFLQKKLAKGQKFFDSGDYQMARQSAKPPSDLAQPLLMRYETTGDRIPTPDTVPARKTSIIQNKAATTAVTKSAATSH